jgi:Protein of unknown function (DUF1579)
MYEFPQPGQEQERLKVLTGMWDSLVRFYFEPGSPPMENRGRSVYKLELGGYFLFREIDVELDSAGEFKGMGFQGRAFTGYDPYRNKYIGVWVDSGSPALYYTEGTFDESGNVYTETSEGPDADGRPLKMRMTTEVQDQDHMLFKMYRLGEDGEAFLVTEIAHSRRK